MALCSGGGGRRGEHFEVTRMAGCGGTNVMNDKVVDGAVGRGGANQEKSKAEDGAEQSKR